MVLTHSKHAGKRAQTSFCSLLVCLELKFPSLNPVSNRNFLIGLCWHTLDMSISLPSDKLTETNQLAHTLLQRQPITVHQVMSFLGKSTLCANGHAQHCQLCCVIQSAMLNVYHSPVQLYLSLHLSLAAQCQLHSLPQLQQNPVPSWFPLPDVAITSNAKPIIGPSIFRVMGF